MHAATSPPAGRATLFCIVAGVVRVLLFFWGVWGFSGRAPRIVQIEVVGGGDGFTHYGVRHFFPFFFERLGAGFLSCLATFSNSSSTARGWVSRNAR